MAALAQVLASPAFARSEKQSAFLRFLVEHYVNQPNTKLNSKILAVECFQRNLGEDPGNSYVRNIASKTRKALLNYYQNLEKLPALELQLAEKGYELRLRRPPPDAKPSSSSDNTQAKTSGKHSSILPTTPSATKLLPVIAVLPFNCTGGDQHHAIVGTMLSDSLIISLAKSTQLSTISRRSTAQLRDNSLHTTQQLGQLLDADYLVEGRYSVRNGQLLLYIELSDCINGEIVWADRLSSSLHALVDESDELIDQALVGINTYLVRHELLRVHSLPFASLRCHSLFIASTNGMHRNSLAEFGRAKDLLELLVRRNPLHPTPLAYLAYWVLLRLFRDSNKEQQADNIAFMQTHLQRALQIDSLHPIALTASASTEFYFNGDPFAARSLLEKALQCAPNEPAAMYRLAACQLYADDASTSYEQAIKTLATSPLDPELYYFHMTAALAAASQKDYPAAIKHAEHSYNIFPDHPANLRILVAAHTATGNEQKLARFCAAHARLEPNFQFDRYCRELPISDHSAIQHVLELIEQSGLERVAC